jgi:hypothetical protein
VSGSKKTIPQRETVAGDACERSSTSNTIFTLLSSSSEFIESIHSESTGPSTTIHFSSPCSENEHSRIAFESTPSAHSLVTGLNAPESSPIVIAFGFSACLC